MTYRKVSPSGLAFLLWLSDIVLQQKMDANTLLIKNYVIVIT